MIIKKIQEQQERKAIVNALVKGGSEPVISEVDNYVSDYSLNHKMGTPLMKRTTVERYGKSNVKKWNKVYSNVEKDLNTAYKAATYLSREIEQSDFNLYSKANLLFSDIENVRNRVYALKESLSNDIAGMSYSYGFGSYTNINFYSIPDRNIPSTTAFIDILHSKVTNYKVTEPKGIIDLTKGQVSYSSDTVSQSEEYGVLEDILKIGNTKNFTVSIGDNYEFGKELKIKCKLDKPVEVSTIQLKFASSSELEGTLKLGFNGGVDEMYKDTGTNIIEWVFLKQLVDEIEITLFKKVPDGADGNATLYVFSLKSLLACNEEYKLSSSLVSKPIPINSVSNHVKLYKNEVLPSETSITYFVGIDDGKSVVSWIPFDKKGVASLDVLKKDEVLLNRSISDFGTLRDGCYYLGRLKDFNNMNSLIFLQGYKQWFVEALESPQFNEAYKININDYNRGNVTEIGFIHHESHNMVIKPNAYIVMSTVVYNYGDIKTKPYHIDLEDIQGKVIVNNAELDIIDGSVNIPFITGENSIKVILYNHHSADKSLTTSFSFSEVGLDSACGRKVKIISKEALKKSSMNNNPNVIAIDGKGDVYSKVNPYSKLKKLITVGNNELNQLDYFRCFARYMYLSDKDYDKFLKDGNINMKLRLLAILKSNDESVSPALKHYSLQVY